jgi:hypothetical protein
VPDSPSPLRRLDSGVLPRVRRGLLALGGLATSPVRRAVRWEGAPERPGAVRAVVTRPGVVALAAALVVFVASAVHLQRFESSLGSAAGEDQVVAEPGAGPVDEIGPRVGSDLELYAEGRLELLEDFDDDREIRAVISFESYLDARGLDLPDELTVERLLVRLPVLDEEPRDIELDGRDPEEVLTAVAGEERDRLEEEAQELTSMLESDIEDEEFVAEFERRLEELTAVQDELGEDPELLYAVVVVGRVDTLQDVQASAGVRLVDPGGDPDETRATRFFGLLPDDDARASHGRSI